MNVDDTYPCHIRAVKWEHERGYYTSSLAFAWVLYVIHYLLLCSLSTSTPPYLSPMRCLRRRRSSSINYNPSLMSSILPCSMSFSSLTLTRSFCILYIHLYMTNYTIQYWYPPTSEWRGTGNNNVPSFDLACQRMRALSTQCDHCCDFRVIEM